MPGIQKERVESDLKKWTYDCEVYKHNWIVVFKDHDTKNYEVIHNDVSRLRAFVGENDFENPVYFGFNSKSYDQYIIKGIRYGFSPEHLHDLNDWIIKGNLGFKYPDLEGVYIAPAFNNVDVRDDMYKELSLKSIEGHLGMDIEETEVPFDLDRPLSEGELKRVVKYCKHDVDATEKIVDLRHGYLKNKVAIGKMAGIEPEKALAMTNAKLTAKLLNATRKEHNDERDYKYPDNLKKEYIPQKVFDYFNQLYDKNLTDEQVFSGNKLNFNIDDCRLTVAWGGVHGAIPYCFIKESEQ